MVDNAWLDVLCYIICIAIGTLIGAGAMESKFSAIAKGSMNNVIDLGGYEYRISLEKLQAVPK